MDPNSILSGWTGTATTVTLRLIDGGAGNDSVQIWDAANTTQLPLGSVNLGNTGQVTASVNFTGSTMTQSGAAITITLGTASGATTRASRLADGLDPVRDRDRTAPPTPARRPR